MRRLVVGAAVVVAAIAGPAGGAHAVVNCGAAGPTCPQAENDSYAVAYAKTLTVSSAVGLLTNDRAPTGMAISVDTNCSCSTTALGGTVAVAASGSFTYTPPAGFSGFDSFQYSITDGHGNDVSSATVNLRVTPVITNDAYNVLENTVLAVHAPGVFANDVRASFDSITSSTAPAHGTLALQADGSFAYTPAHNFVGADSFTYTVFDLDFDAHYSATVRLAVLPPAPPPPPPPAKPTGYWMAGTTGTVYAFGQVHNYGNANTDNVTRIEPTPSRHGYWVVNSSGHVFAFGDARTYGNAPNLAPGELVTSLSATPTGHGYWLFTNRGRAVNRGDAHFYGDVHKLALNGPIVGSSATPTGHGYYMVGTDGGIFSFGDAHFHGSMGGVRLNKPINGLVPTSTNRGYWLVASDGGIFAFGDAHFHGSMGGAHLNRPIIGMVPYGNGYLMVSSDGGIFAFSNLPFLGSLGANPPANPIVGVASGG